MYFINHDYLNTLRLQALVKPYGHSESVAGLSGGLHHSVCKVMKKQQFTDRQTKCIRKLAKMDLSQVNWMAMNDCCYSNLILGDISAPGVLLIWQNSFVMSEFLHPHSLTETSKVEAIELIRSRALCRISFDKETTCQLSMPMASSMLLK